MGRNARKRKKLLQEGKDPKSSRVMSEPYESGRGYKDIVKENPLFEKYYKAQSIMPESDWDKFLTTARANLPLTFRITGTRVMAESVLACLEQRYLHELRGLEIEGEKIVLHPLKWYPNRLAWHLSLSRPTVRKSPLLSKFHSFLVRENEQGNISRQEGVSMIPPLLLGVEPGHRVLDMCAAPGSKTVQLIEALHSTDNPIPEGVVIANDADNKRCYMLVHQAKRLNSPCFMVTNHDASAFPTLYYHDENNARHPLYYDRVLCDVPCSGDGTLRKNPTIWRGWNPGQALSLHKLQLRILVKGLELLSPGGRLVYSTCSLNPIEDEAVVHTALRLSQGSVALVDCSTQLEGLLRTDGLSDWKVMSKNSEWVCPGGCGPGDADYVIPSAFPPTHDEAPQFHLNRCLRILPHLQDTGGFFVAVFEKTDWLPWQLEAISKKQPNATTDTQCDNGGTEDALTDKVSQLPKRPDEILGKPGYTKKRQGFREDPFVYLDEKDPVIENFSSFFDFPDSFPGGQLMTRTHSGKKNALYLTSRLVKELTIRNEKRCKIINTGVRVLGRSEHPNAICKFRLSQEGLQTMRHFVKSKIIPIELNDLIKVLSEANPLTTSLSTRAQEKINPLSFCPALFIYNPELDAISEPVKIPLKCPILLSGWIGPKSVRLFVPMAERCHFLSMLGEEPPDKLSLDTIGHPKKKKKPQDDSELYSDTSDDEVTNEGSVLAEEDMVVEGGVVKEEETVDSILDEQDEEKDGN